MNVGRCSGRPESGPAAGRQAGPQTVPRLGGWPATVARRLLDEVHDHVPLGARIATIGRIAQFPRLPCLPLGRTSPPPRTGPVAPCAARPKSRVPVSRAASANTSCPGRPSALGAAPPPPRAVRSGTWGRPPIDLGDAGEIREAVAAHRSSGTNRMAKPDKVASYRAPRRGAR